MTQLSIFEAICKEMAQEGPITIRTREAVHTLSYIIHEESILQDIVDREGMTYETTGDKGQKYVKTRAEYTELQRLRDKKRAYLSKLGFGTGEAEGDEFS